MARWNVREILARDTDTLGLVIGFAILAVLAVFTIIVISVR